MDLGALIAMLMLMAFLFGVVIYSKGLSRMERTLDRMEAATQVVAEDLKATAKDLRLAAKQRTDLGSTLNRMESATHVVADNLASSIDRADKADDKIPGASADAALRPPVPEDSDH